MTSDELFLALVLVDVLLGKVDQETVKHARLIETRDEYDFALKLAGAPADVDYDELEQLAREDLIRYLRGDRS